MKNIEAVRLNQDKTSGDYFLIYGTDKGLRLDMRYAGDTLWLSQAQIAELFDVDRSVITKHIANIYVEGERDKDTTSAKFAQVRQEGERQVNRYIDSYNLDMIISVGYHVSSAQATLFRRWATGILVQFATKGFVVDAPRLKQPENFDRIKELRDIIRDIRADEANIYRELRSICAMCQDYNRSEQQSRTFFQQIQAKLIYAVVSRTSSEIVYERADGKADNMGLQTWPHDNIRKADAVIAKNYLTETEGAREACKPKLRS
ncbi:RhuM family protein [Candidatus Tokpelaia sp.]|uniref:RhuM family protein n=1 Tax=Candidatus Tokpelaia sp. TaxID=2233777 RepID=UPI001FEFF6A2|nr:RhuM family protein [Candidatus Tokpelaia sp.]